MKAPSIESAYDMGATGAPATEDERLAFEAWMRGHCWSLGAEWNGETYIGKMETPGKHFYPFAMVTRQLWAAWRDRAALTQNEAGAERPLAKVASNAGLGVAVPPAPTFGED